MFFEAGFIVQGLGRMLVLGCHKGIKVSGRRLPKTNVPFHFVMGP